MLYVDNTSKLLGLEDVIVKKYGHKKMKNILRSSYQDVLIVAQTVD